MQRWETLGAILLITSVFAGCIGTTDDPVDPQSASPVNVQTPTAPRLEAPSAMPQDWDASEPTIVSSDDGTLYMTAPAGGAEKPNMAEGAAWLWRSTDGGDSWDVLRQPDLSDATPSTITCSCDSDVATSPDGWVYYTDWWIAPGGVGNFLLEASDDGGESWQKTPITIPHPDSVDRQWLVTGEDGFVGIFYSYFPGVDVANTVYINNQPQRIEAVFSTDHGRTFSQPVTVVEPGSGSFAQISKPVNLGDDRLAMAYGQMNYGESDDFWTAPGEVRVAVSTDRGETWEQRTIAQAPDGFDNLWAVQAAGDDAGNLHVAWAARNGTNMTAYHAQTPDLGETVDGPTELRSAGLNFLPWIAARGDGQVAVGWYGGNATGDPREAPEDHEWHAYLAERANATGEFATTRADDEPVKIGPMCPRGAACEEDRELLDYVGLTYDPSGRLHYAFAQSDTADESQSISAKVHYAGEVIHANASD